MKLSSERGAVAVEFALLLPILVALLLGIIEFGLAFNSQLQVTNAAREGARAAVVWTPASTASSATVAADNAAIAATSSPAPALKASMITVSFASSSGAPLTSCAAGATATVVISYPYKFLSGWFGTGYTQTGRSAMRCGG